MRTPATRATMRTGAAQADGEAARAAAINLTRLVVPCAIEANIGETGLEPATAPPPAGAIQAYPGRTARRRAGPFTARARPLRRSAPQRGRGAS